MARYLKPLSELNAYYKHDNWNGYTILELMYFLSEARNGKHKDLLSIASLFSSEVEIKDLWETRG